MAIATYIASVSKRRTKVLEDTDFDLQLPPVSRSVPVTGLARKVSVQIASCRREWEEALHLVAGRYQSRGYETSDACESRFTSYHALPDTTVFVAKEDSRVVATLSLVMDNTLLGLPLESVYAPEVKELRRAGHRLVEVTSLADEGLGPRDFLGVFTGLMRLMSQYFVRKSATALVIAINPRHRYFYRRVMGFQPLGPCRAYPAARNHPAEALLLTPELLRRNSPAMHQQIFGEPLCPAALTAAPMPAELVRYFGRTSSQTEARLVEQILRHVQKNGSPRRW